MKVLVIGRSGQLARCLAEQGHAHDKLKLAFAGRPDVDLETPGSAAAAIWSAAPDVIINTAAYTAVDKAEDERERAFRINAEAAGEIARAAAAIDSLLVHLSTDYVFDGRSHRAYREDDPVRPINVYGASKLAGEEAVRSSNSTHLILRTSWVYSTVGRNFVKTILHLASEQDEIRVVTDQQGCPTSAHDLAAAILDLVHKCRGTPGETYHLAGTGSCSWAEFAGEILRTSQAAGGPSASLRQISTVDSPTTAARPVNSRLDCSAIDDRLSIRLPEWQQSMAAVVKQLIVAG